MINRSYYEALSLWFFPEMQACLIGLMMLKCDQWASSILNVWIQRRTANLCHQSSGLNHHKHRLCVLLTFYCLKHHIHLITNSKRAIILCSRRNVGISLKLSHLWSSHLFSTGRVSFFSSGSENLHQVEKVEWGTRYAITVSFTCDPDYAIADPSLPWGPHEVLARALGPKKNT